MSVPDHYIIIVDDDEDDISFLEELFQGHGIGSFISFSSGSDLIDFLNTAKFKPALIVLDYNMPKQNGLEVLIEIRQIQSFNDVNIIMLSTGIQADAKQKLLQAGATACLVKPYGIDEARKAMTEIIAHIRIPE